VVITPSPARAFSWLRPETLSFGKVVNVTFDVALYLDAVVARRENN
jgi:hypothetical protein